MLGRVYSLKRKAASATRVLPRIVGFASLQTKPTSVARQGGLFFYSLSFPSLEEELSDLNDKLSGGERQHQDFIKIHSSLQFDYSSLSAGRVLGA